MAKSGNGSAGGGNGGGNGGGSLALTGITPCGGMKSFLKTTAGAIGLALLMAGPASAATIESPPGAAPGAALATPPGAAVANARADRDGDRIEDTLGARIAASRAGDRFDVIVLFEGPDAVGRGRAAAGPFAVTREFSIINGFQAQLTGPEISGLSRAPGLFRISGNAEVTAHDIPSNDDMGATDARMDFVDGNGNAIDGSEVTICVIDTGIDIPHELFVTKGMTSDRFFDAIGGLADPYDDNGHGSHVSGIAAGNGTTSLAVEAIGVAPGASLKVAKVLDGNGSGDNASVIAGIDWCAKQPDVDILSMSLGGPSTDGTDPMSVAVNCVADPDYTTKISQTSLCGGSNIAKIIVVSAGNSGALWSTIGAPGVAEYAITVGSVAEWSGDSLTNWQDDGLYLNTFSSRGPVIDADGNTVLNVDGSPRIKPDIVGPGSRVLSAYVFNNTPDNSYGVASGTSMSAPFVTGVIALMLQADPTLGDDDTPTGGLLPHQKVRNILTSTAKDLGASGPDNEYGYGVIDAYSAVAEASGAVGYAPNAYPGYEWVREPGDPPQQPSVGDFGNWTREFTVTADMLVDPITPIVATATIDGTFVQTCIFWLTPDVCWFWDSLWSPDLEIILEEELPAGSDAWFQVPVPPGSGEVTLSECPAYGECGTVGRAEVVHFIPLHEGTYRFRVFPFFDGVDATGGNFDFEISMGAPLPVGNTSPTAGFSFMSSGLTASFTDESSDSDGTVTGWSWDFGDGNTSNEHSPYHIYSDTGIYNVCLIATSIDSICSETLCYDVAIGYPRCFANYNYVITGHYVEFQDSSFSTPGSPFIISYNWDFGDLATCGPSCFEPCHTYATDGSYNVVLNVTDDNFCQDSLIVVVNTNFSLLPVVTLGSSAANDTVCIGDSITFTASPGGYLIQPLSYVFYNDTIIVQSGTGNTFTTAAISDGDSITVLLINANGCLSDTSNAVVTTVLSLPNVGLVSSDSILCGGYNISFTATPAGLDIYLFYDVLKTNF
ncbi:MAG: S8 family serine peptidase [Proteobacteria bacterium]|nr:S8 family serine peptidase [Pseudomonadota bacterium]